MSDRTLKGCRSRPKKQHGEREARDSVALVRKGKVTDTIGGEVVRNRAGEVYKVLFFVMTSFGFQTRGHHIIILGM